MAHIAEPIVEAIPAAPLVDNTGNTADIGYNQGIDNAVEAARQFVAKPDPCRELADWLAAMQESAAEAVRRLAELPGATLDRTP